MWKYRKLSKDSLVLETGSGHNPWWRSDILVDRWLYKDKERSEFALCVDRPLLISSGERLPFKDKTFNFIFCSQTIEHSKNPTAFLKEIERVGKSGLIVCPNAIRERLFGWKFHRWFIVKEKETLKFYLKKHFPNSFGNFFHNLYQKKFFFRRFCLENDEFLDIYYYWEEKIFFKIFSKTGGTLVEKWDKEMETFLASIKWQEEKDLVFFVRELFDRGRKKILKEKSRFLWQIKKKLDPEINLKILKKFICCPICHNDLIWVKEGLSLICVQCKEKFPVERGIPILLDKRERRKGL